jgi:hypothetical protein
VGELALIAPLFAALLLLLSLWARLALTRLALIHLTRDAAILLAHDVDHWGAEAATQQQEVRDLARHYPPLDPVQLRLEMQPVSLEGVSLGSSAFARLLLGSKLCLRYHLQPKGLIAQAFPQGLDMEEWGVVQGDPWQNPAMSIIKAFTGG